MFSVALFGHSFQTVWFGMCTCQAGEDFEEQDIGVDGRYYMELVHSDSSDVLAPAKKSKSNTGKSRSAGPKKTASGRSRRTDEVHRTPKTKKVTEFRHCDEYWPWPLQPFEI